MCLAIPALVVSIGEQSGGSPATVSVAGTERSVDLSLVPEATVGDFVVIHSGYAISIVSRERAMETLEMLGLIPPDAPNRPSTRQSFDAIPIDP